MINHKNNKREPVITVKTYKSNTYGHQVHILGECKVVYSPDKPLSCGAKVWIETRGDIELATSDTKSNDATTNISVEPTHQLAVNLDRALSEFLAKKRKRILNKNKLSACLSS